jgi:hypothetical protein
VEVKMPVEMTLRVRVRVQLRVGVQLSVKALQVRKEGARSWPPG